MRATHETPVVQLLLPELFRDLQHVCRDARGAHESRDAVLSAIRLRAPFPEGPVPGLVQAQDSVVRRVQQLVPLLHDPDVALGLAHEAIQARRALAHAARVEPEDVVRASDDGRDVVAFVPSEKRA